MSTLERAIEIAAHARAGQIDKAGQPYILHPLRIMRPMTTEAERITAVKRDLLSHDADRRLRVSLSYGGIPQRVIVVRHFHRLISVDYAFLRQQYLRV